MENEDYFRRMYEQNGTCNAFDYSSRSFPMHHEEKGSVIGPIVDNLSFSAAQTAAMNISQPIVQHISHRQRPHQQHVPPHMLELQHREPPQLIGQQFHEQQQLYKCNECGSRCANLKTLWMHQRTHLNPSGDILTSLPPFKTTENGPAILPHPVSTPRDLEHNPESSLSMTPVNLHKYPTILQRYSPEPTQPCNPDTPEMHNLHSHIIFNSQPSQPPKIYNQEPPENFEKSKKIESEIRYKNEKKSNEHRDMIEGVNSIQNTFLNLQHSIFQDEGSITPESNAPDDSNIDNTDNSCNGVEIENHKKYLELPDKKCRPKVCLGKQCYNDEPETESDKVIMQLVGTTTPIMDVISWLQQHQLLKSEMRCDRCKRFMTWKTSHTKWMDKFFWRCDNNKCPNLYCSKTIRAGSIFDKSKLCLKDWLHIMYEWSKKVGSSAASTQVNISRCTIANCYSFFREVCVMYFKTNPIKLGGPGIPVEIDVYCLSTEFIKKQKHKHGTESQPLIWLLVIVDTNCNPSGPSVGYMEIVETSDVETLLPIIIKVVQPGTTIHSKDWSAYRKIQGLLDIYTGGSSNNSVNFVDVNTSLHKHIIESYWKKHKSILTAMRGTRRGNLNSYLQEFMWHERFSDNALEILCEQIAIQYSDDSYNDNIDGSSLGEETKKKTKENVVKVDESRDLSEEPPHKKYRSKVKKLCHSIFEDNKREKPSTPGTSYIDNTDGFFSGEEVENHEENMNYLKAVPSKQINSKVQHRRPHIKKVNYFVENNEPETEGDRVIVRLVAATTPIIDVIRWLQQQQLLKSEMKCDRCKYYMNWKTSHAKWMDRFFWKCENNSCPNLYCTKTIRVGSIFDKSKLCLKDWLHIMYKWSKTVGSSAASSQVNISRCTIANCYSFFREVCEVYFKSNGIKLGGPGITIEIDIFCLSSEKSKKQKRIPGSETQPPIWVLCIVDTNCTPSIGYMEIVETRDVATLLPIILKVVQPGSIIYCREWRAYRKIQGYSDMDESVNHSVIFVDVDTIVPKRTIESYWKKHRKYLSAMRGTRRGNLNSYFQEFMWHERFSDNALEILCEQISVQYSDASLIDNIDGSCLKEEI